MYRNLWIPLKTNEGNMNRILTRGDSIGKYASENGAMTTTRMFKRQLPKLKVMFNQWNRNAKAVKEKREVQNVLK